MNSLAASRSLSSVETDAGEVGPAIDVKKIKVFASLSLFGHGGRIA
jgi:hypothetical protein